MSNNLKEDVFDTILASAFGEYIDKETEAVPSREELDEMFPVPKNGLRKLKREIKKKRPKSKAVLYLQRVAVVFLAAVTLFSGVMALSTEVRSTVVDAIVGWFDKFASVNFGDDPVVPVKSIENVGDFEIGYIPEGMMLISTTTDHNDMRYMYVSDGAEYIQISLSLSNTTKFAGDIELSEYTLITINDSEGHIFYNEEERLGSLFFENNGYTIMISCILDREELIKVAENIK